MRQSSTSRGPMLALAVGVVALVGFLTLPSDGLPQAVVFLLAAAAAAVAMIVRVTRDRALSSEWRWMAAGQLVYLVAVFPGYLIPIGFGGSLGFPSVVDAAYFAAYGLYAIFLVGVIRRRGALPAGQGRLALLDAAIFTAPLASALWVGIIEPNVAAPGVTVAARTAAVAYPVCLTLLFGLAVRLFLGSRRPSTPEALLMIWIGAELLADIIYGYTAATGKFQYGAWTTVLWLVSYTAVGALALHPRLPVLFRPAEAPRAPTAVRIGMLLPASVVPVTAASFAEPGTGALRGLLVVAGLTFLLVLLRMSLVSGDLEEQRRLASERDEISQRLAAQRDELARSAAAVESTDDSVIVTSLDGTILGWNRGASDLYGYNADEVLGKEVSLVMSEEQRQSLGSILEAAAAGEPVKMISRDRRKDGSQVPTSVTVSPVFGDGGAVTAVVGIARDISEQERARALERERETQLEQLAFHDPLTGLANRALLNDRLARALLSRRAARVALLLLDLDDFKSINDVSGHGAGDELLIEVSRRLLGCVRADDTVARLGGDEFAVLLEDSDAQQVTRRVLHELAQPVFIDGREVVPSASIGIADSEGIDDAGSLLVRADVAMYTAKRAGKGQAVAFSEEMSETLLRRSDLTDALRRAISRDEIVVHYQPIIDTEAGRVSRMEALVRWKRPDGLIPPSEFLPLAEESGLIVDIGESVLSQALLDLRPWLQEDTGNSVAVNVSAVQLAGGTFPETVRRLLEASAVRGHQLVLEVTETLFLDYTYNIVGQLVELRKLGIRVSIDDFGTGYSSLGRLQTLPVDSLKIDKSFVDLLIVGDEDLPILRLMILMAHSLGLDVTAEGVETRIQAERLTALGCDYLQGYHFSRPVTAEEATNAASTNATTTFSDVVGVNTIGSTVLMVEDDAVIRTIVRAVLTAGAYDVEEALSGAEAIALANSIIPDCVIVDLGLPDMDGLDVVRALRNEPDLDRTAIVVLTGAANRDVKSASFAAGADDYIVKPLTPKHLPVRVRGAIKSARGSLRTHPLHR